MQNYFALSIPRVNNSLDFSPLTNALQNFGASQRENTANLMAMDKNRQEREAMQFNKQRLMTQDRIAAEERKGKIALAADNLKDPRQRELALNYLLSQDPGLRDLGPAMSDHTTALKAIAARFGQYQNPLEIEAQKAKIASDTALANKYTAEAFEKNLGNQDVAAMYGMAPPTMNMGSYSNAPGEGLPTVAGSTVVNTTALPREGMPMPRGEDPRALMDREADEIKMLPTASEQRAARISRAKGDMKTYNEIMAPVREKLDVTRALKKSLELAKELPARYSGTFESAVGKFQGADPDSWASYINPFVWAGRLGGEISNMGNRFSPGEVRDDIAGITRGIVDKIKKLQGLGAKSADSNFELQNLIVQAGNLAQANDVNEYYRRLRALNDRINTLYNIQTGVEFPETQYNDSAKDFPLKEQGRLNNYRKDKGLE